ncbi:hypothetical protein L596_000560 [Steinernema carpocapsae]|uniref:Secreted protein n=1 Tax=Steinernema carpocapsae TaxID=34508 RepID=A0A4U8UMQ0_STECR|nr:hypothetical protein L596_000560 [Steinernema carpocapsae]
MLVTPFLSVTLFVSLVHCRRRGPDGVFGRMNYGQKLEPDDMKFSLFWEFHENAKSVRSKSWKREASAQSTVYN